MHPDPRFTFRHLVNVPGIGGVARLPDIDGCIVLVLYAVEAAREPDRQLVFESLDQAWIEIGRIVRAFEIPRGWPDRACLQRLSLDTDPEARALPRPRWSAQPASVAEAHAVVDGLRAIGFFDPDHPEAGGRRGRQMSPVRAPSRDNVVALRSATPSSPFHSGC